MTTPEQYRGEVEAVLIEAEQYLSTGSLREPWNMVEHGEPVEGLVMLAWVISEQEVLVAPSIVERIRTLSEGWPEADDLPKDFDDWGSAAAQSR